MEDFDILSDHSCNEEAYYSDQIDSDIEAELYGMIHHDTQDNSVSHQEKSGSTENKSISLQEKSDSIESKSVSPHDRSDSTENHSLLLQNSARSTADDSVTLKDTSNSAKKLNESTKNNIQNCSTPAQIANTNIFCSDTIVNNNLYYSFESPILKQKIQSNQVKSGNSKKGVIDKRAKRKSDVVSEVLGSIQKNRKSMQPENSVSKQKKNNPDHISIMNEENSFVEVLEESSDSDSDSSIIFLDPDESELQTNIEKETVVLSSDAEDSDSSMERSFSYACQRKQTEISKINSASNNKDPWHINYEDIFRTKKQSNRYHENAVITCSKCQLKGHSAKFCSVPKAMKCFFCGDYHSGMNCKNKICTKCFQQGHDRRRCYVRHVDTCELCRMRGHSQRNCPDLWRRYHLTTSKGSIVKGNPNPHSPLYCYNCGSKGHYGAGCIENRTDRWSFPTWTSVVSYKNPISVLRRLGREERNFQGREERSFQGREERNFQGRLERNFQGREERNFQGRVERNFQGREERNFQERERFERTPLFHRRKENEAYPRRSPTYIQNMKRKKKKKKKSPIAQENSNHQSTNTPSNIVQNEVYFPRTPRVFPGSSAVHLPSKKSKKLKKRKNNIARQQLMHHIGLQQRLGFPIPSTI